MGTTSLAQRVVLADGRGHRRTLSRVAHHPCLGSQRGLPYSANRGEQSMNRIVLDELKQQIPLLEYLQAHDWQQAKPIGFGRLLGLCPLHADHKPSFLVDPHKNLFYCYGCRRGGRYCTKLRVSIGCSYTAMLRRLLTCTNVVSARRN